MVELLLVAFIVASTLDIIAYRLVSKRVRVLEETKVTKVPPLSCPQCGSREVTPGFTKVAKGFVFIKDQNLWCYSCNNVTHTKTGKVEKHEYGQIAQVTEKRPEELDDAN